MKQCIALRAIVQDSNENVLLIRESKNYTEGTNSGKWDVPGGRLGIGEPWRDGLLREVKEETGLQIYEIIPFSLHEWRPIINGEQTQIVAIFFRTKTKERTIILSQDHDAYEWIDPHDYIHYSMSEELTDVFQQYLQIM